ncbi:hypothetical protein KC930_02885 [Candidatus Saccharibacteria bacterium]|nr:hypothetical protein [Candidatus Saccharibacteria bacterium]
MFDDNQQMAGGNSDGQYQDQPQPMTDQSQYAPVSDDQMQTGFQSQPADYTQPTQDSATSVPTSQVSDDDLLTIKQDALNTLSPLVGQLDQSPEEKFRTTMMMIQASDDSGLIRVAYEAAQNIEDDKVKAQALLDVINEINYFTSHQS